MNIKKIVIVAAGVTLLAAGCSKTSTNRELPAANPPAESKPQAVIAPELDPSQNWIRFYPGESLRFNLLFPTRWVGDEGNTDSRFVLRSRKGADGTTVDDVVMDFTISSMTAKTVAAQNAEDMKGSKDSSPVTTVKTDTGVPYAFATYIDKNNKPTLGVAVQYLTGQYIRIKVTGNVTHPYVGRMIQSIALTQ